MRTRTQVLLKKERMETTLPMLIEYCVTSKQVAGCSAITLIGFRTNLGKFVRFMPSQGHTLKLSDLIIHDARVYITSMRGKAVKFEGHPLNRPIPDYTFSPQTIHKHVTTPRLLQLGQAGGLHQEFNL